MKKVLIIIVLLPFFTFAQVSQNQLIKGEVKDLNGEPIIGATIYWKESTIGTTSDNNGIFEIIRGNNDTLIVGFVGLKTDTILVFENTYLNIKLIESLSLDEIIINEKRSDSYISDINPIKVEVITEHELQKAACCDLSACFDTEASVESKTTNILTNSKELRIFGLSGTYNQVLVDGMPLIQGITHTYGISSIPGTLVNTIYVAKGANSVLQGYESISGQINVILKEPDQTDKLLINGYVNSFFEHQYNLNYSKNIRKWNMLLSAHTTQPGSRVDKNEDTFLDLPLIKRYSFYNKWTLGNQKQWGWHSKTGVRYLNENRIGGQFNFDESIHQGSNILYGQTVQISQPEIYTKTGYRINNNSHIVLFNSASFQNQHSYFGTTKYLAEQFNIYNNIQYEFQWGEKHLLTAGISNRFLNLKEEISFEMEDSLNRTYDDNYSLDEKVTGIFIENNMNFSERTTLIYGARLDYHNKHKYFFTPRILLRHNFGINTSFRVSCGSGWRTVKFFSENINLLISSRDILFNEKLKPEEAINYGFNLTHKYFQNNLDIQLSADFYQTRFLNQIFPDYNTPTKAYIENFDGTSISNAIQLDTKFLLYKRIETKFSYNFLDVFRIIENSKYILPFNSKHRLTSTFSYKPLDNNWHIDMNLHWHGEKKLPNTSSNPSEFQFPEKSKPHTLVNIQFTKKIKLLDLYFGIENIFDFRQEEPIVSWENPFGEYFDTSLVWGNTRGREMYLGFRFNLN